MTALRDALEERDDAAAAGARLLRPDGTGQPSAWRFPTPATALIGALFLHKRFTVQSRSERTRTVDWAQSAALLVRTDAAREIEWFDPAFFVYSDEVDFCRRLRDAGWRTLYVPAAVAVHHEQLSTGKVPERRIVELSRNRDRYMRKHHSRGRATVRVLTAWAYAVRSLAALRARPRPAALLAPRDRDAAPDRARGCARPRSSTTAPAPERCEQFWIAVPAGETTHHGRRSRRCPGRGPRALSPEGERVTGVGDLARAVRARRAQQRRLDPPPASACAVAAARLRARAARAHRAGGPTGRARPWSREEGAQRGVATMDAGCGGRWRGGVRCVPDERARRLRARAAGGPRRGGPGGS